MDQVYRIGRRLGKLMLALLMVVSLFDLTSLFANDETNAPAKVIQLCDEENIQSTEDGELLIPWSSTIETTDENMLLYNDYENTMQDNLYATPDTLNLQIVDHTGGKQIELVEGTDYELYYTNPSDGLFTMNKEDAAQFTHFKIMFTDKTKTFSNMMIKYNTHAKIADVKENEQERKFLNEATFKIETDYWITETATYTYTNPNFKPVENSMNAQENVNAIYAPREFTWEDDTVKIKASVTQRDIPDNVVMKAERVTESADKENNIITEILDQASGTKYYYQVTFTSNDEVVAIDQSKIKFESSVKAKIAPISDDIEMDESREPTKAPLKSTLSAVKASNYEVWWHDDSETQTKNHENPGYKYGDFGEDASYDMFYILEHYNVFVKGNYNGQHVVGPMAVGGTAACSPGGSTTGVRYPHEVPSIFKGQFTPNTVNTYSTVPIFIGTDKDLNGNDVNTNKKEYYLGGIDPDTGLDRTYTNYYYTSIDNDYLNFDDAFNSIENQLEKYSNVSYVGVDPAGNSLTTTVIEPYNEDPESNSTVKGNDENYYFEKTDKGIGLRIKLGYNYIINAELINKLSYIVYDYSNFNEATTKTTFINVNSTGLVTLPEMYKAMEDKLGKNPVISAQGEIKAAYHFDSLEVERAFNIAYLLKDATTVNFHNGGKLVGHLIAPKASVDIAGGDFNGSVIALNASSTAEAHMWPFKLDAAISFTKTVNYKRPEPGEMFSFVLENVYKPNSAANIPTVKQKNDSTGLVNFTIKDLTVEGTYIYKITEENAGLGYIENTDVFYAKVIVSKKENDNAGKALARFEGFYKSYDGNGEVSGKINDDLVINNVRQLSVEKNWKKEDGTPLSTEDMNPINVTLYQKYVEDTGYKILFNYYVTSLGGNTEKIDCYQTDPLKKNATYKVNVKTKSTYDKVKNAVVSSGDATVKLNSNKQNNTWDPTNSIQDDFDIVVENIKSDVVVDVNITNEGATVTSSNYQIDNKKGENSSNYVTEVEKGEKVYEKFTLGENNIWYKTFKDLPASGSKDGKEYKYTYRVEEEAIPGFETNYENNDGILSGVITINNKAKNTDLEVRKISSTGNTTALENAEFSMYKFKENDFVENDRLKFVCKNNDNIENRSYVYSENGSETTIITNKNGLLELSGFPVGDYVLEETKAPNGFVIDNQYIFIHFDYNSEKSYYSVGRNKPTNDKNKIFFNEENKITDTSNIIKYKFTVENTPDIDVPETGGTPNDRYQKLGFLLACTGLAMYAIYEVKRKKNKEKSTN